MPVVRAKVVPLLELLGDERALPSSMLVRIALDVLEPIAASSITAHVSARREGSRHVVANVVVGVRGKAKLVGRGNHSGIQLLLWELLAGRAAPASQVPPLGAVVDDVEPDVAEVVAASIAERADLPDARALLKALVIASAGCVGTHRDVAKAVAQRVHETRGAGDGAVAHAHAPAPREAPAPVGSPPLVPPETRSHALADRPSVGAPRATTSTMLPPPTASTVPQPSRTAEPPRDDDAAAELDAVLSEELDRIAPHGWDDFAFQLPPDAALGADDPQALTDDDLVAIESRHPPAGPGAPPMPADAMAPHAGQRVDVLMIEPDAFTASHLAGVLRRTGYEVEVVSRADLAVTRACVVQPRCIVCDDELVEGGGLAIALRARNNSPRACLAPFVFLAGRANAGAAPPQRAGARDVWLAKPFSTEVLLEHVGRFVGPAVAKTDSSMLPPLGATAMDGSLSLISLRTLIRMLELERRSGILKITSQDREAAIRLRDGRATRAKLLGRSVGVGTALETLLSWNDGRFTFQPSLAATDVASRA